MGASTFSNWVPRAEAKDLKEAFRNERERSLHESGHSYSGEIGMKHEVRLVCSKPTLAEARAEAEALEARGGRYADRDSPAWAIEVPGDKGGWLMFGVARS